MKTAWFITMFSITVAGMIGLFIAETAAGGYFAGLATGVGIMRLAMYREHGI